MLFSPALFVLAEPSYAARHKSRHLSQIRQVTIHRTLDTTAEILYQRFKNTKRWEPGSYTGGLQGYHFFIDRNALATQICPIDMVTAGARGYNLASIHLAFGCEPPQKPTAAQLEVCYGIMQSLVMGFGRILRVYGHTELGGSTADPTKVCPGPSFPLDEMRDFMHNIAKQVESAEDRLQLLGFKVRSG